jgi:hypothetical protein
VEEKKTNENREAKGGRDNEFFFNSSFFLFSVVPKKNKKNSLFARKNIIFFTKLKKTKEGERSKRSRVAGAQRQRPQQLPVSFDARTSRTHQSLR